MDNSFLHRKKLLLVDDEPDLLKMVSDILKDAGFEAVLTAASVKEAVMVAKQEKPDLMILDVMLPDGDGFSLMEQLRTFTDVPVIFLTAKDEAADKLAGLGLGADDYITKPFSTNELLARIRTSLRHSNRVVTNDSVSEKPYAALGLKIDFMKRIITRDGEPIHLTPVEYKIVAYIAKNSGKVITYSSILKNVWGPNMDENDNKILRVNMANIRRKIEPNPAEPTYILTELGVGYRMLEDSSL